ncbi:MAG: hypothetical protein Tsb0013_17780 [Phycisphaerales bacterium]
MITPAPLEPTTIGALEMRRMAQVRAALADEHERFGGLVAAWSGIGSWNSEADGWSPDTPTTRADLEGVIGFYTRRGDDARVTVTPHQDTALLADLGALGFRLRGVDLQYAIALDETTAEPPTYPDGLRTSGLDPSNEDDIASWSHLTAQTHFRRPPTDDDARLNRRVVTHPNTRCLFVMHGDERVGLAGVEVYDGLACLFMGGVLEAWRNRGVQLALIRERLLIAREMGAHHAIIGSLPGSPTERNALRSGMRMVFPKLEFVRTRDVI